MTDTDPIEELADTLYDALYAITPYAEPHFADERQGLRNAVRSVLRQAADSSTRNPDDCIAAISARAKAATEGPWERYPEYGTTFFANTNGPHLQGVGDFNFGVGEQAEADEAFVSHARQDVDALLACVAVLETDLEQARADLQQSQTAFQGLARRMGMAIEPVQHQCQAEYGGPGYTRCELPDQHDGRHNSSLGNLRRASWGGDRDA